MKGKRSIRENIFMTRVINCAMNSELLGKFCYLLKLIVINSFFSRGREKLAISDDDESRLGVECSVLQQVFFDTHSRSFLRPESIKYAITCFSGTRKEPVTDLQSLKERKLLISCLFHFLPEVKNSSSFSSRTASSLLFSKLV